MPNGALFGRAKLTDSEIDAINLGGGSSLF
jgi:hypothetical protein